MSKLENKKVDVSHRESEKGAAMVMVLLMAFLLLAASAGLLLESSMNTANVTDATAEQQAYNAAESGIQSVLNVLRGNTVPSVLLDDTKPATDPANLIDFKRAIDLSASNLPGDPSTNARLSRWINYNYTPTGAAVADRVTIGAGGYTPDRGYAFSLRIDDPDNTGSAISYSTTGNIDGSGTSKTFGSGGNTVTITYTPAFAANVDVSSGMAATDFGYFRLTTTGAGATLADDVRFSIEVNMTVPYTATRVVRGYIEAGTITPTSVGSSKINLDSIAFELMGSTTTFVADPLNLNPPNVNAGRTDLLGSTTPAEPIRLRVRSVGFGPRGARKQLEAIVQKNFFNGMTAPATLTMVGSSTGFVFAPGSSNVTEYSGEDAVSDLQIPPIGATNDANLDVIQDSVDGLPPHPFNGDVVGTPANVSAELPTWLQSAANLDQTIQALRNVSQSSGRYFPSGVVPPNVGDNANARGITFCDGDLEFSGAGGGILVVTGKLTLEGNFNFNGLIIVTGAQGVERSGGGTGTLQGNIVVSPYDPNNLAAGWTGPKYDLSGGGASDIVYNSSSLANGLTAVSNFVLGVAEK
ncbi:MAG: hypothetical protein OEM82_06780 [Acidobacteriota bacterium]|nr:hypothetical protein [Acidobacteriota bacterium]MDH3528819.1 hypothetical protein [Acidobacteriota bacterium]